METNEPLKRERKNAHVPLVKLQYKFITLHYTCCAFSSINNIFVSETSGDIPPRHYEWEGGGREG